MDLLFEKFYKNFTLGFSDYGENGWKRTVQNPRFGVAHGCRVCAAAGLEHRRKGNHTCFQAGVSSPRQRAKKLEFVEIIVVNICGCQNRHTCIYIYIYWYIIILCIYVYIYIYVMKRITCMKCNSVDSTHSYFGMHTHMHPYNLSTYWLGTSPDETNSVFIVLAHHYNWLKGQKTRMFWSFEGYSFIVKFPLKPIRWITKTRRTLNNGKPGVAREIWWVVSLFEQMWTGPWFIWYSHCHIL